MRGGEGGGCFDTVEEEDFVLGGKEDDAAYVSLNYIWNWILKVVSWEI